MKGAAIGAVISAARRRPRWALRGEQRWVGLAVARRNGLRGDGTGGILASSKGCGLVAVQLVRAGAPRSATASAPPTLEGIRPGHKVAREQCQSDARSEAHGRGQDGEVHDVL